MNLKRHLLATSLALILPLAIGHASVEDHAAKMASQLQTQETPNFKSIKNVAQRKQAFVEYLRPSYEVVATKILSQRKRLEQLRDQLNDGVELSNDQADWLRNLAAQYRLSDLKQDSNAIDKLLVRVDILPPELVLSQAATESGWGTSSLMLEANNFFGHTCVQKGCGVTPYRRKGPQLKVFESPTMAVQAYMRNVNTHPAYSQVRKLRANMRAEVKPLDAVVLAKGLKRYSTLGDGYVKKIQGMIRSNRKYWPANGLD